MVEVNDYAREWREYIRRRKLLFWLLIGWVPITIAFVLITSLFVHSRHGIIPLVIVYAAIYFAVVQVAWARVTFWHCPRCGQVYSGRWAFWYWNDFSPSCAHCGFSGYSFG